jgi:hypothetical protein
MRQERSYNGNLMKKGKDNEEILKHWLLSSQKIKEIIDFREFRLAQRIDVDFGIETIDGNIVLAEVKSDNYIYENGNLCFEVYRINHYAENNWFYLGWGWRSPAKSLIIRNPKTNLIFIFDFLKLRRFIGQWVGEIGEKLIYETIETKKGTRSKYQIVIETDTTKTTFNFLIPMRDLKKYNLYKQYQA